MAVDEWLLESTDCSILRVYDWNGKWGSLGCFCSLNQALGKYPSVCWVRRSTGGGVVDHQNDWTYTLVIPETEKLANVSASQSYRLIHEKLSNVLSDRFKLVDSASSVSELGGVCFEKPVAFDIMNDVGNKVAGAGQRRTKQGLLHQGSVGGRCESTDSVNRSIRFAEALSEHWERVDLTPPEDVIREKVATRYGNEEWTRRR